MLGARVHMATRAPRTATIHVTAASVDSQEAPGRPADRRGALVSVCCCSGRAVLAGAESDAGMQRLPLSTGAMKLRGLLPPDVKSLGAVGVMLML